uniref:Uncharacterized protein n=1 Tax=Cacopsylla melanoneura TaxID=428564 RepID=A0A8D8YM47_9HEMI
MYFVFTFLIVISFGSKLSLVRSGLCTFQNEFLCLIKPCDDFFVKDIVHLITWSLLPCFNAILGSSGLILCLMEIAESPLLTSSESMGSSSPMIQGTIIGALSHCRGAGPNL